MSPISPTSLAVTSDARTPAGRAVGGQPHSSAILRSSRRSLETESAQLGQTRPGPARPAPRIGRATAGRRCAGGVTAVRLAALAPYPGTRTRRSAWSRLRTRVTSATTSSRAPTRSWMLPTPVGQPDRRQVVPRGGSPGRWPGHHPDRSCQLVASRAARAALSCGGTSRTGRPAATQGARGRRPVAGRALDPIGRRRGRRVSCQ